jgi:indole-3-glycerol phosphate synthase
MSVLTDTNYFGGSLDDLLLARAVASFPLLRKEFIIDPYQIIEAKAYGADAILLIAASLSSEELKDFSALAKSLNLDVLLEVHNLEELEKSMLPTVDLLGVNNRNLKTFEVSIEISKSLSGLIPKEFVKVSESGISATETIKELKEYGFDGFLIGETFMKTENPGLSAKLFIEELK